MIVQHWVFILSGFLSVSLLSCLSPPMQILRVASLNINGGRSAQKRAVVSEIVSQKKSLM